MSQSRKDYLAARATYRNLSEEKRDILAQKSVDLAREKFEEKLFETALEELETGTGPKGLYAKVLVAVDGDKDKAKVEYLRRRVDQLFREMEVQVLAKEVEE